MYHANPAADLISRFPQEVRRLFRREREIAMIVYDRGLITAREVEAALSVPLSNASVRSMLRRLVRKGILTRVECGRRHTFVYGPALTQASAREVALKQFAQDFYAGSLSSLTDAIANMFASGSGGPAPPIVTPDHSRMS